MKEVVTESKKCSKLLYTDFQKVILDFQLHEHERFLKSFTNLFKCVDADLDGIISEDEFRMLIN